MEVTVEETQMQDVAQRLLEQISGSDTQEQATVVGLVGELGAGKTTFVKALAGVLGVTETVTSPTFVIEKIYELKNQPFGRLVHIDAYRLEDERDLKTLGWDELLKHADNLIVVEWADRIKDALPSGAQMLTFEVVGENERKVTFA